MPCPPADSSAAGFLIRSGVGELTRAAPVSHPTTWACRSCRAPLGQVRDRVLYPLAPVESVDGRGVARVPCPGCRRVRVWVPAGATTMGQTEAVRAERVRSLPHLTRGRKSRGREMER